MAQLSDEAIDNLASTRQDNLAFQRGDAGAARGRDKSVGENETAMGGRMLLTPFTRSRYGRTRPSRIYICVGRRT
jgi:hypothetical protein